MNNNSIIKTLNRLDAFKAMRRFLDDYYFFGKQTDELGDLLGWTQLFPDGGTWDPVFWIDWEAIVRVNEDLNIIQAYKAMQKFIQKFIERLDYSELKQLLGLMELLPDGTSKDPIMWQKWQTVFEMALEGNFS